MTLDDLTSTIDDFNMFEDFIKEFILSDNALFRMIYFPQKNPLLPEDEENPYKIFEDIEGDNTHGAVLFGRKFNTILNTATIVVLVDFECYQKANSQEFDKITIIFRIILKGVDVQKLENGVDRAFIIGKLISDNFDLANVNGLGQVKKKSMGYSAINEENSSYLLTFSANSFSSDIGNNKNFKKRIFGDTNG